MSMRDKIAEIIRDGELQMISYEGIADAIMHSLPELLMSDYDAQQARIAELKAALVNIEVAAGKQCGKKGWILQLTREALKGESK